MSDERQDNPTMPQRRSRKRSALRVAVIMLGLFVLLTLYDYSCVLLWVGGYQLTVHIDSTGSPPTVVGCLAVGRQDEAERLQEVVRDFSPHQAFEPGSNCAIADPFKGEPLNVWIKMTGRESGFGRGLAQYQYRFLVVLAEWPDGRRVCKVVDISIGRVSKEMTVSLP